MQEVVTFPGADLVIRLLIGFAVGALIGLERQKKANLERTVGVRSFGLHSLMGTLAAYSYVISGNVIILVYATVISVMIVAIQMYEKIIRSMRKGMTTTIVFALSFILGALVGFDTIPTGQLLGPLEGFSMTVSFLVFLVLGFKQELASAVAGISHEEMISAAELGVLILFFWPLIPQTIPVPGLPQGFPIFTAYILIVLLLSISFVNYIVVKKYKHRGEYFFGFFGGFVNSEATVSSLTDNYVKVERKRPGMYAVAALFANIAMVLRNGFLVVILDPSLRIAGYYLIPLLILIGVGAIRLVMEQKSQENMEKQEIDTKLVSPFEFGAALRFAAIFTFILYISQIAQEVASDTGFLIISAVGGLVNAGAVVTTATLFFASGSISLDTAVYSVILSTLMALLNKIIFVYQADRDTKLVKLVARDAFIMVASVAIYLLLFATGVFTII